MRLPTIRVRLTLLYGVLLLVSGCLLITLVYALLRPTLPDKLAAAIPNPAASGSAVADELPTLQSLDAITRAALDQLLTVSVIALAVFVVLSIALAWWAAGRALRPVHALTATARRLSADNLHERINLTGPKDELAELADTFDELLDRLERVVSAQRRFVANAAHELRTPVAIHRATAEIGLADADPAQVEHVRAQLLAVAERTERLIDGLLLLAASDQGLNHWEDVALDEIAVAVVNEFNDRDIRISTELRATNVHGDPILLTHLIRNLISNAMAYNIPDGRVGIRVGPGFIEVTNTGPQVPAEVVPLLFEPFHRDQPRSHHPGQGAGLGLSIVASITKAHHGTIAARPNPTPEGGLTIRIKFPRDAVM